MGKGNKPLNKMNKVNQWYFSYKLLHNSDKTQTINSSLNKDTFNNTECVELLGNVLDCRLTRSIDNIDIDNCCKKLARVFIYEDIPVMCSN